MGKFWIGLGHGGGDSGAVAVYASKQFEEFTVSCAVLERAKQIINQQGLDVGYIPKDMKLATKRIPWIKQNIPATDTIIELHMNSGGATVSGAEMYYKAGSETDRIQSDKFIKAYTRATGQKNRGSKLDTSTRFKRLGIIRDVPCHSFLIEMGFISNKEDLEVVQTKAALGLINIILSYMNKPFLDSETVKQEITPEFLPSIEKAKKKRGVNGEPVWGNWDRPKDEITAFTLAHVLHKLGVLKDPTGVLTNERVAVAFDRLKLFE